MEGVNTRTLIACLTLTAIAATTPAAAGASDVALQPDVGAQFLTALDGTVVQVAGSAPNYKLMRRTGAGAFAPVPGAPEALYRSVDLGHDGAGRLVLTYIRCSDERNCKAYSDDLSGHRVTYKHLAPKRCTLTTAPARWRSRVAYALTCMKAHGRSGIYDASRSGLFIRTGKGAAKRLRAPQGRHYIDRVDLRGSTVAAVAPGNQSYAFTQTVGAAHLRSMRITDNQGETDDYSILSMALGAGAQVWTLVVDSEEEGSAVTEVIGRLGPSGCAREGMAVTVDPNTYVMTIPAGAIAVDGYKPYLATSAGVIAHVFAPSSTGCPS